MALNWLLGDFANGNIIRTTPLPVSETSGLINIDIHGEDGADIDVSRANLTQAEQDNWQTTFRELTRFCVLEDDTKAWNDPKAILFAGFINKKSDAIADGVISLQLAGLNEYTKSRIAADVWVSPVTDPNAGMGFGGSTWDNVIRNTIAKCFSTDGIPAGKPTPPQVLGTPHGGTDQTYMKNILWNDVKTYHEVLREISEVDSGDGLEWRFVPRWRDLNKNSIVWDVKVGTATVPHIGEDTTVTISLAENENKFSEYETRLDSNDLYSKLYIQSKFGDATAGTGADFDQASVEATTFPILVERFFNPGVELTDAQRQAQLSSRLNYAAKAKFEAGFTVEEQTDPFLWLNRLGNKLQVNGVNGTISGGHNATVRIVGVSFNPGNGSIRVDVQQLGATYPRLPKSEIGDMLPGDGTGNSKPLPKPVSGGTTTTTEPAPAPAPTDPYAGVDGVLTPGDLWGDIGHNPWETDPKAGIAPSIAFQNFKETSKEITTFDGDFPIHPFSMFHDTGNRIYGLDHIEQGFGTKITAGTPTHYNGGIDTATGLPLSPLKPFYIKKTHMANGVMGDVTTVGQVDVAQLQKMLSVWSPAGTDYSTSQWFERGIGASNWVAGGRFYFCLSDLWMHKDGDAKPVSTYDSSIANLHPGTTKWHTNGLMSLISAPLDSKTGVINGPWDEGIKNEDTYIFPSTPLISRYGRKIVFSGGFPHIGGLFVNGMRDGKKLYDFYKHLETGTLPTPHPFWRTGLNPIIPLGVWSFSWEKGIELPLTGVRDFDLNGSPHRYPHVYSAWEGTYGNSLNYSSFNFNGNMYHCRPTNDYPFFIRRIKMGHDGKPVGTSKFTDVIAEPTEVYGKFFGFPVIIKGNLFVECYQTSGTTDYFITKDIASDTMGVTNFTPKNSPWNEFAYKFTVTNPSSSFIMESNRFYNNRWGNSYSNVSVNTFWGSRNFVYGNTVYTFKLDNNAAGVRNTLWCRSMEAYTP